MLDLLKYIDARLGEPSTWASIAIMLSLAHVSVDPGLWHTLSAYGVVVASALGVLLGEIGARPPMQIATDVIESLAAGLKLLPPLSAPVAETVQPAATSAVPAAIVEQAPAPATTA